MAVELMHKVSAPRAVVIILFTVVVLPLGYPLSLAGFGGVFNE